MSYIGNTPTTAAFPFDQFTGNGTTTAFTLTYAPAGPTSIMVAISGVVQNPNLYSVIGTTLTFSPAPPTGTDNIAVLYLGLPVIGSSSPGNTAFLSSTDLTATAGQTVFASAGAYTPGFVQVYRNGARLGNADFTATNGTTITLASAATAGDLVTIEYYTLTSLVNALPLTGGTVTGSTTFNSAVTINGASASGFTGMKNRIINGNMVVDQRNAGAIFNPPPNQGYSLDRWTTWLSQNTYSVQRNAGAITPPVGFANYLGVTVTSATTIGVSDYFGVGQKIEGYNIADLNWGTASAQTITVSFWVRSSLTGNFGAVIRRGDGGQYYAFTYAISAANTWEYKTVTVPGPTTGTWATDNATGLFLLFGFGAGTNQTASSNNTWVNGGVLGASGALPVVATNGATFYITGVQLERGSNATSFEFIDYGRQLIQCQRYFQRYAAGSGTLVVYGYWDAINTFNGTLIYPVTPRTTPTGIGVSSASHFNVNNSTVGNPTATTVVINSSSSYSLDLSALVASNGASNGKAGRIYSNSSLAWIELQGTEL
jgi:hypothetical protein